MTFIPKLSNQIAKICEKYNVEIISSTNNNIKTLNGIINYKLKNNPNF